MIVKEKIRLVILDVDGVLTDGKLLIGSDGNEYKNFNVKDGMGISIAKYAGIKFGIITGRKSNSVTIRARELGIEYLFQGVDNKLEILDSIIKKLNINKREICYMGDDLNDLPIIREVGISFAPNDAIDLVKKSVNKVTSATGGNGAVREMIDIILKEQFNYDKLIDDYLLKKYNIIQ
ncbi:KdsC family phosphatase [Niallia circulans]|uniref:KdsC family phosphatase n=1 Tax=Niallia circulans TaxID=1397 RepID=UPI001F3C504B|nr:HAD hydrolase family protein [Niallia circulans]MCF2649122.1 HAD hydrolase family protein [Niallia circulans]